VARLKCTSETRPKAEAPDCPSLSADGEGRFHISRYHTSRNYALYDGNGLVVVTVYRKGAEAVRDRLEAQEKAIEDLQHQLADLTTRFREQATLSPQPSLLESFNARTWRPPKQLPLIAAEEMATYRITAPRRPALRR
jgi:hypothetical protein